MNSTPLFKGRITSKIIKKEPVNQRTKREKYKKASKRVPVEHTNRKCKIFKICSCQFRGKHSNYESTWLLIATIVNLKEATRHLRFSTV